jgi:hypothetical protein
MRVELAVAACGLLVLAGCSGGVVGGNETEGSQQAGVAGARLTGVVHGGQNPISGAHVYLFAAASGASGVGAAAYGGRGIAASASNASASLLNATDTGYSDSVGAYVLTGSDGSFSISGDYTCTAGQQVYLYSLGGDPGLGTGANAAAGLMAVLGSCPTAGTFSSGLYVVVNEVSTVAAAYAMAGFATDATHVGSSGTALALTGIANAFANAANLETIGTGVALATTPAGNGTVPQAEINTLADILAACVNSNGSLVSPAPCYELEMDTRVSPFDTAKAAISIAHSPVTSVAGLYALSSSTPPFAPALTAQPNDWTVQIAFTGGLTSSFGTLAIDGSGNAWVAEYANGAVKLSSSGAVLSGSGGYAGYGLTGPERVAIDPSGNAWFTGGGTRYIVEFSNAGSFINSYDASESGVSSFVTGANGIVVDGSGNVWVPTVNGLAEFANSGLPIGFVVSGPQWASPGGYAAGAADSSGNVWVTPYLTSAPDFLTAFSTAASGGSGEFMLLYTGGGGLNYPWAIAIDGSGNGWVTNNVGNSISKVSSAGVALSPSSGFTAGAGLVAPYCLSVDGASNVWVGGDTSENIVEFNNSGILLSGGSGLRTGDQNPVLSIAVDGSGNIWTIAGSVNEILGAAVPVVTPLSVGVKNNMLGTRP